jgi:WhiB family transcriptional regulator, redox-sensing transcriptional regulator
VTLAKLSRLAFDFIEEPWMAEAACRDHPAELWFLDDLKAPLTKRLHMGRDYAEARAICATCPFSGLEGPCLAHALASGSDFGLFGGYSPMERRAIVRGRDRRRTRQSVSALT